MKLEIINKAYLSHRDKIGRPLVSRYIDDSVMPAMPFLLLDIVQNIYIVQVEPVKMIHKAKHLKKVWQDKYYAVSKDFSDAMTSEQIDGAIEYIDDFARHLYNYIEILRIEIYSLLTDLDDERRRKVSYIILAEVLTWGAGGCWRNSYVADVKVYYIGNTKHYRLIEDNNPDIEIMAKTIAMLASEYAPEIDTQQVQSMDKFDRLWDSCCARIIQYSRQYEEQRDKTEDEES